MTLVGHRGARGEAPENTLGGFRYALDHNVRHFELDVHLSADGIPVVIHDAELKRTTDCTDRVGNLEAATLARCNAAAHWPEWPQPEPVPTLEAVLTLLAGERCSVQVEVKCETDDAADLLIDRLAPLLPAFTGDLDMVITSFDTRLLQLAMLKLAQFPRGLVYDHKRRNPLAMAQTLHCQWLIGHWRLLGKRAIRRAKASDMRLSVFTVNDVRVARRLFNDGVDSVITDFPVAMARQLADAPH